MAEETPAQQAAAGLLDELAQFAEPEEETAEAPEAQAEGEQPQDEAAEGLPEITWETPEELKELLEAPDFDEEEEDEPVAAEGTYEPEDEFQSPEQERLAKQLRKAQKQLAWEKEQRVKASRKGWADEAQKYFQFANVKDIQATSRRAFLKEAERQHKQVLKVVKPAWDQLAAERAKMREQVTAEVRADAEQRWGRPISGPQAPTTLENTQQNARQRMETGRGLKDVLKEKLVRGEVNL